MITKLSNKEPILLKEIMLEAGYSKATAKNPELNLTGKLGWKMLLNTIDDAPLMKKLSEIALSKDKRASISAIQEIFKLKDRYPATKNKIVGLFDKLG